MLPSVYYQLNSQLLTIKAKWPHKRIALSKYVRTGRHDRTQTTLFPGALSASMYVCKEKCASSCCLVEYV